MMRSMFSGVSGLRVHQTKMDVIANNISNVNTTGYKSSRVTFSEIFSQTTAGASGANPATGRGGINAMQIGLGANIASIDMQMTTGAGQRTDNPYDLMIQGEGFFIVGDAGGTYFTRAGAFRLDESGYLTNPNGMKLQGWRAVYDGPGATRIDKSGLEGIRIGPEHESIPAEATTFINYGGNLNYIDGTKESSISFFDSLGNKYTVKTQFVYDSTNGEWTMSLADRAYINGDTNNVVSIDVATAQTHDVDHALAGAKASELAIEVGASVPSGPVVYQDVTNTMKFTSTGALDPGSLTGLVMTITPDATNMRPDIQFGVGTGGTVSVYLGNLTQQNGLANASADTVDGCPPGTLNAVSVGPDGKIVGNYSNGRTRDLWQISIAKFRNPAGLERVGNNLYRTTPNSGDFDGIGEEVGGDTAILPGVLEMSNVDLASEFTEMITTQRGFQANSRIITTSDDMLQELVNMKR